MRSSARIGEKVDLHTADGRKFETFETLHKVLTQLHVDAHALKEKGNSLYSSREYDTAEAFYLRGLDIINQQILPRYELTSNIDNDTFQKDECIQIFTSLSEQTSKLYACLVCNLILTQLGLKKPREAETFASSFLNDPARSTITLVESTPSNTSTLAPNDFTFGQDKLFQYCCNFPKLWYRRAQTRESLHLFQDAESDYSMSLSLLQKNILSCSDSSRVNNQYEDIHKVSREIKDVMVALKRVRLEMKQEQSLEKESSVKTCMTPYEVKEQRNSSSFKEMTPQHNGDTVEIPKENHSQPCYKRTHESSETKPQHKHSSQSILPRRIHPSPDRQRVIVLQLLAQTLNAHQLQDLRPQDINNFHGDSSATKTEIENILLSSKPIPGEAYFLINYDWWTRWCELCNFFLDKEYNAILKLISVARSGRTTREQSLQSYLDEKEFLDQKRRVILRLLPPGSVIPSIKQDSTTFKAIRKRSNSLSSESSSTKSSQSSNSYEDDEFPIDNSSLLLYYNDSQTMGSNASNLLDNISSSKELFYWDWRHGQRMTCMSNVRNEPLQLPLRPYLVRGYHYEILRREVYAALVSWFGEKTPSICRRTIKNKETGVPQLILYPELLHRIENSTMNQEPKRYTCDACGSKRALFRCRNCNNVHYCDQTCQGSHWVYHRDSCKKLEKRRFNGHGKNDSESNRQLKSIEYMSLSLESLQHGSRQGRMGLNNLGNTCFMNAALQCLSHTTPLTRYFLSDRFKADINVKNALGTGGKLAHAYDHLIKELWMGGKSSTSPTRLKRAIALFAPQFAGTAQHDSQEFLAFLLDGLHEDLNLVRNPPYVVIPDFTIDKDLNVAGAEAWGAFCYRNDSLVMDSFYGQFKSTCICPNCNRVSVSYDAFNHISLEIPQNVDMEISVTLFQTQTTNAPYRPMRYLIQLPRNSCWRNLKESLSYLAGIPVPRLSVCDVYDNEIYEIFDDDNYLTNIQPSDTIVAYEIDHYNKSTIHAIATHVRICADKEKYGTRRTHKIPVGYPLLTSFDAKLTCHDVWEHIWRQVSYLFVGMQDTQRRDARSLLTIRLVRKDGSPLDVFANDSSPNLMKDSIDIRNSFSNLPRHSNAQLSTFLGPDCTERFLFLHLEWIDEHPEMNFPHECFLQTEDHSSTIGLRRPLQCCVTLERCFEKFTRPERLDQYNQWYCSVCKEHVRALKTIELWKIPNILIVHFKRFEYMHAFRRDKIETLVEYPIDNLDMKRFCGSTKTDGNEGIFSEVRVPAVYDLFGVINHFGRMGFGHYMAICRRFGENIIERDWFSFDDSHVQEISQNDIVSSSAYVLFYRRRIFA